MRLAVRHSIHRRAGALLVALACLSAAACSIDALLESEVAPDVRLSMSVQSSEVAANPGTNVTLGASITRLGDYRGNVAFSITGLPNGIEGQIGGATTSGQVTSATITFRVGEGVPPGDYLATIHGTGGSNGATAAQVVIRVTALPGIAIALSASSLTIIRGGVAPLGVTLTRTSAPDPLTLSLVGANGITIESGNNPVAGVSTELTIAVAPSVTPGTYAMTLHGTSTGVPSRDVPLSIVVSPDPLQLIASNVSALQASIATLDVVVNRYGLEGAVDFSAVGLPTGVTAAFEGGAAQATRARMTMRVGSTTLPGSYVVTIRGRGVGDAAASAVFVLTIGPSGVAVTLTPSFVSVLQGASAASTLALTRTSYAGAVAVQVLDVPLGISAAISEPTTTGNSTFVTVSADIGMTPGGYPLTVRTIPSAPDGAPALDPVTSILTVTVVEAPPSTGNVLLDWSACSAPDWVAAQDGNGAWTQLVGAQGRYRFTINTNRGAFAYAEANKQISVRVGTSAELAAAPINLCPTVEPSTHTVFATAVHSSAAELFTWRLGGGVGTSTLAQPNFAITGVRDGVHDLIGWGSTQTLGQRMHLTRDVNALQGDNLGQVSLINQNSFTPYNVTMTFNGFSNEARAYTMSYLTGPSCEATMLYQTSLGAASGTFVASVFGVPTGYQRPSDYHLFDMLATNGTTRRSVSASFHSHVPGRSLALPPALFPTVSTIAGSYRRLRVFFPITLAAAYNGTVTLRYSDNLHSMSLSASVASLGAGTPILDLPELTGVTGFPASAAMPVGTTGTWLLSVTGSTGAGQSLCTEDSQRVSWSRNGVF